MDVEPMEPPVSHPPRDSSQDPFSLQGGSGDKERCDLDPIFKAGVEAKLRGRSVHDNPYAVGSQERDEWEAGFNARPELDMDDDPDAPL